MTLEDFTNLSALEKVYYMITTTNDINNQIWFQQLKRALENVSPNILIIDNRLKRIYDEIIIDYIKNNKKK